MLNRALAAGFERLENRQLFSAAALTIAGAPSPVDEGSSYSLNLAVSSLPSGTSVTSYSINWGDGQVTPVSGASVTNPMVVNHTYLDGPALNLNVTATATLSDAEVLNSNTGSSTVTSDGSPDPAFGTGGTASTGLSLGTVTNNIAVQSNGQIISAGVVSGVMNLVRLNSDGSIDGTLSLSDTAARTSTSSVARVLVETDPTDSSKTDYLVAGTSGSTGVLWRYHAEDGSPDATFGVGGKLVLPGDALVDATLDPNGNIATVGMNGTNVVASRFNAAGLTDISFNGGTQIYPFDLIGTASGVVATANAVTVVADGFTFATGNTESHLLKFTNSGLAGDAILQVDPLNPSPSMHYDSVALDGAGNYVVGGRNLGGPSTASFSVARFDANLNLDTSFGGGFVTTTASGAGGGITNIAVGSDGKIVAVGVRNSAGQSVLARYNNDGSLDSGFGSGGIALAGPSTGFVTPESVLVQPDLKVLVAIQDASGTGPFQDVVRLGSSSSSVSTPVTVTVNNVAPATAAIVSPANAVRNQTVNFASSFTDPGVLDTHTVVWNFGDGSPAVSSSAAAGVTGAVSTSHAFTTTGTFNVTLTVTDKDGGIGSSSTSIGIDIVDIQGGNLFVGGTAGPDIITINPGSDPGIQAFINGTVFTHLQPTGRIVVFGGDGNDIIQIAGGITLSTELYGGNGNDLIKGGNGSNLIIGGAGDDVLVGGNSRDILIGGAGNDALVTGGGEDVLVAMSTAYDSNATALESIQNEWTRSDLNFAGRVGHLLNGGGLNGTSVLTSATTVDDNATDVLNGGGGSDLFIISGNDITDAGHSDTVVDLTWVTI